MTGKKSKENLVVKPTDTGVKITNKIAGNFVLDGFQRLWRDEILCDIKLVCNSVEILAHKAILVMFSDYFKAMFTIGLTESSQTMPCVQLDESTPEALTSLLQYMYTGSLSVNKNTVQDLIVLTDLLQMRDIKDHCCQFMEINLDSSNCLGIWDFAETYGCTSLLVKAIALIKRRFSIIVKTEEFLDISESRLKVILHFEDLCLGIEGEDEVYKGVLRWYEHNASNRQQFIKDVLSLVKLNHVSDSVVDDLRKMTVMVENQELIDWIMSERMTSNCPPRHPIQCIYAVGGYLQSRTGPMCPRLRAVERYDFKENKWDNNVENLPILASGVQVFNIHGKLFCTSFEMSHDQTFTGLSDSVSSSPGFFEYDNLLNTWKDVSDQFSVGATRVIHECLQNSGSICVCSRTNQIYTVSVVDVHVVSSSVEDGDVTFGNPVRLADLMHANLYSNHTAVMFQDHLYVLGGDERISASEIFPTASVYMYDDVNERWISKCSMQEPRARFCSAVVGDYIYAIGGFNTRRLRSVERYNPATNTWRYVESMNKERSHFQCVVYQNKIYVMGGKSYSRFEGGARKVLNSCEVYDPDNDLWTFTAPMKKARCLFGAELF